MELLKDVQKYFRIEEFRLSQKEIIEQIDPPPADEGSVCCQ